ncbi:hypothetical protein BPC006_I2888 [Burkholderia pseudomallei BPC006]|nr:hypothetical protein BPC006_I2888 [Burkholderia pseudomallei BPC006]
MAVSSAGENADAIAHSALRVQKLADDARITP